MIYNFETKEFSKLFNEILMKENFKTFTAGLSHIFEDGALLAEEQAHHPYIHINFKTVKIILFTHKINGLHENDFLMAKKIDNL